MELSRRQKEIIELVKDNQPITSQEIADNLELSRAAIRNDLSVLSLLDILDAKPRVGYFYKGQEPKPGSLDSLFNIKVKEIMSLPVNVLEDTSIYDAIVTMFLEDTGTIFVIDESDELVGVISRKDLLKMAMGNRDLNEIPVSLAMTRVPKVIVAVEDETLLMAARKIVDNKVDSLPVIEDDKVIGRISKTSINNALVDYATEIGSD
ncbi:MAG: helix-turn-helix transcriptional regulator [Bacillota bacterium]